MGSHSPFLAIVGPGSAFNTYSHNQERKALENDVILLVEVTSDVNWIEPRDLPLTDIKKYSIKALGGTFEDGFLVGFADGAVWFLRKDIPTNVILPFMSISGDRKRDRSIELKPHAIKTLKEF